MGTAKRLAEHVRRGLPVFPCVNDPDDSDRHKRPLTAHGFKDATTDTRAVKQLFRAHPDALWAAPTGPGSKLLVVDIDPDGAEWFAEHFSDLACGYIVHTQRPNGRHLYYQYPDGLDLRNSTSKLAPGIDVRASGGYVILWAVHGNQTVGEPDDIGPPPQWLLDKIQKAKSNGNGRGPLRPEVGSRNDYFTRLAGAYVTQGYDEDQIAALLRAENAKLDDPLDDAEFERTVLKSVAAWVEKRGPSPAAVVGETAISLTCVSRIEPRPLDPVWDGVLWAGKPTLLVGDPGEGKSLATIDIAARISTGAPWPCSDARREPANVLMVSAEDDYADTIVPRLSAAGADLERIIKVGDVTTPTDDGSSRHDPLYLDKHLSLVGHALRQYRPRLLIIDPLSAYMGRDVEQNNEGAVRTVLAGLADIAAEHACAVLAVRHFRKGGADTAKGRIIGSVAFVAAARAAYVVARDPEDEDRRLLLCAKCNLAADTSGYFFWIHTTDLGTPYVCWGDEREPRSADEVLGVAPDRRGSVDAAADWLGVVLAEKAIPSTELRQLAKEAGHSWRAVERARREFGGAVVERVGGVGAAGKWQWRIETKATTPKIANPVSEIGGLKGDSAVTGVQGNKSGKAANISDKDCDLSGAKASTADGGGGLSEYEDF